MIHKMLQPKTQMILSVIWLVTYTQTQDRFTSSAPCIEYIGYT